MFYRTIKRDLEASTAAFYEGPWTSITEINLQDFRAAGDSIFLPSGWVETPLPTNTAKKDAAKKHLAQYTGKTTWSV